MSITQMPTLSLTQNNQEKQIFSNILITIRHTKTRALESYIYSFKVGYFNLVLKITIQVGLELLTWLI